MLVISKHLFIVANNKTLKKLTIISNIIGVKRFICKLK